MSEPALIPDLVETAPAAANQPGDLHVVHASLATFRGHGLGYH